MTIAETMREMLAAGVHFGHQKSRWNPKMKRYIHSETNGVHILDLGISSKLLHASMKLVESVTSNGGLILFVGTKKQAANIVITAAENASMPYVSNRWLGGTLTNWPTLSKRIERLKEIDEINTEELYLTMTKKESVLYERDKMRMERSFGGLRKLTQIPRAIFCIDPNIDEIAVLEAKKIGVPVIAMCDSNANPEKVDYPIPANDDAIRSIQLITKYISDAAIKGSEIYAAKNKEKTNASLTKQSNNNVKNETTSGKR